MAINRRDLLRGVGFGTAAASYGLVAPKASWARAANTKKDVLSSFNKVADSPSFVTAYLEGGPEKLDRSGQTWFTNGLEMKERSTDAGRRSFILHAPSAPLLRIHLRWPFAVDNSLLFLGDAWERSYGDLGWRYMDGERPLPWYFLATGSDGTAGCGVQTGAGALAFWQLDEQGVSLWLDVRNGGRAVQLGDRELPLVTVLARVFTGESAFNSARHFCLALSPNRRLPKQRIYGGNNWYYAYGKSSSDDILADSERMAVCASDVQVKDNRPWMVIDDGWQPNETAGPWDRGNAHFPDMPKLASDMRKKGVQPGIWTRPLFTLEQVPESWVLQSPGSKRQQKREAGRMLDPTVPEVQAKVEQDISLLSKWGYRLIKHDYSTFDMFGQWGGTMGNSITADGDWSFANRTLTNAEVIRNLYLAIRKSAGENALVLGCNTVGHLSAGIFEMQRTGDDTSGRDWSRTRRTGINTLAFRMAQHDAFFAIDADCVGLTNIIPWELNRQWLSLLANSGTPLFVSLSPDAFQAEQKTALRQAFAVAATAQPAAEPMDWLRNTEPSEWLLHGRHEHFDWFGKTGSAPSFGW